MLIIEGVRRAVETARDQLPDYRVRATAYSPGRPGPVTTMVFTVVDPDRRTAVALG
ncbi:hypothetical protein OHB26_37085 [Nocardia sp. NBC_01503]|uniref:hypothetical protein n=1 Tax=Nocardia sp. NBC_01503 TaxID=2975997 RepID=UPI002E7B8849|nr:hypothetical protein [Nocardia sp. NBC_01503]WTL32414.1 hypothetical protein OHB26_37085 [Nocardia sp. NBC_01503]